MKFTYFVFTLIFSLQVFAETDFRQEVRDLNQVYGHAMDYPILVVDKVEIREVLSQEGNLDGHDEAAAAQVLISYFNQKSGIALSEEDAINLVPFVTVSNDSALSVPYFDRSGTDMRKKFCVVLPSGADNTHQKELERILAITETNGEIYRGINMEKVLGLLSLEELKLFSLYHELSHCLDTVFTPEMYKSGGDTHQIHLAEVFAEVNALFLISQRKGLIQLGVPRAILRGLYSKYFGTYLAKKGPTMSPGQEQGGSVYFLSVALMEAQRRIENLQFDVANLSLNDTLKLSKDVVDAHALKSRSFVGLNRMLAEDPKKVLAEYKSKAEEHPNFFFPVYQDLLYYHAFFKSLKSFMGGS